MICIRQINGSKHDVLVRSKMEFIAMSFTQPDLDICSMVRYQMRKLCILAGPSVQHELIRLTISGTGNVGTAGAWRDNKYLGGRDSVFGEKRLVSVTDGGVNI